MPQGFAIAIDGPVASGKGTIAQKLANEIQGVYLYTGGMYRAVALMCITKGMDIHNAEQVISILDDVHIDIAAHQLLLNGEDVTERIKEHDTAHGASVVAVIPEVRSVLLKRQQEIGRDAVENGKIVVSEGRDTGTAVFPDAALKIYLTASPEIRAKRRLIQYNEHESKLDTMLQKVKERDERDQNREASPLPSNPEELGYVIIDNSEMSEEETLEVIKGELRKRKLVQT